MSNAIAKREKQLATYIPADLNQRMKAYAAQNKMKIKEVVEAAIASYISQGGEEMPKTTRSDYAKGNWRDGATPWGQALRFFRIELLGASTNAIAELPGFPHHPKTWCDRERKATDASTIADMFRVLAIAAESGELAEVSARRERARQLALKQTEPEDPEVDDGSDGLSARVEALEKLLTGDGLERRIIGAVTKAFE